MPKASVTRQIASEKQKLIDFVLDIEKYPEFIPFCINSKVHEKNDNDAVVKKPEVESQNEGNFKQSKAPSKRYKIQEVIKPNQVILVQVLKDERGLKGAALSTFISIAGKYIVLMPNTPKGGGISRKIFNSGERKKIRSISVSYTLLPLTTTPYV